MDLTNLSEVAKLNIVYILILCEMYYFVPSMPNIRDGSMSIHMAFESVLQLVL